MTRLVPLACILLLLAGLGAQERNPSSSELPGLLYTSAPDYEPLAWMHGHDRFPRGATAYIQDGNGRRRLVDFADSADPAVSFDGTRALFAGKKRPQDRWQIWELGLSDHSLRRVTACADDCVRPLYLPEDRIVYAERTQRQFVIKVASRDGGQAAPLTYSPGNFLPTDILRDGRILFEAGFPLDNGSRPDIYSVYSDGSGVESYRCDHGNARHAGRQLSSGDIVFASRGTLARFTSARAGEIEIAAPAKEYSGEVAELPNGDWLIASRPRRNRRFEISRWTHGKEGMQPVVADNDADLVQPTILRSRPIPNRHPSGLHDWNYANLLCLNAYTSKLHFPEGAIAEVRLYTRNSFGHEALLGTTAVEKDGSFYMRTPGDQPLKLELLDHSGQSLGREQGWFWLRRGEQRVCVGCHAGPERAPENAVPAVLLRSTVAADMTGRKTPTAAGGH